MVFGKSPAFPTVFLCWYAIGSETAAMSKGSISHLIRRLRGGAAILLVARKILLAQAKSFLTRLLNKSPNLKGSFSEIDLRLFQGIVVLRGLYLVRSSEGRRVVEASCREVSIQVQWRELLQGTLVGRAHLSAPHIEIFSDHERHQDGNPQADALLDLCRETQRFMPFHLRSLEVSKGCIEYLSPFTSPPFKLGLDRVSLSATNLTNVGSATSAHVFVEGQTTGKGRFWMRLTLPSPSDTLTFDLQAGLNQINLVELNDVLRAWAKFDLKRGVCSSYAEFSVDHGRYQGFIQPHFQDLDVFAWKKEQSKSLFQICRQAAIAFLTGVFKNQSRDELALNIPISGTFTDANVDTWAAVGSLLKNAFVRSLFPRSEDDNSTRETKRRSRPHFWRRTQSRC